MHFVAALDRVPEMRAVLTLFEGVATGAADGYGRMAGKPAATLLHLGPGLGNGLANLHNARKARTPIVNIVGEHATWHTAVDSPLQSDIRTVAANVSPWTRTASSPDTVGADTAEAVITASQGQVATLILPADVSWTSGARPADVDADAEGRAVDADRLQSVAQAIRNAKRPAFLVGGRILREPALSTAAAIAAAAGARVIVETFPARWQRGAGSPVVERLAYLAEVAQVQLADVDCLVLVDAAPPVSFFAYPGRSNAVTADHCAVVDFLAPDHDIADSLEALTDALDLDLETVRPSLNQPTTPGRPIGRLTAKSVCQAIAHTLPENAIVCDEAQTSGTSLPTLTAGAPPHDWLALTGGAIGQGLPLAVGAAAACPNRPVVAVQADGSSMYTIQALWSMAREGLDVTIVLLNNRAYSILNLELGRVGARRGGRRARAQMDLSQPPIDFVSIARGLGVPAVRPMSAAALVDELNRAFAEPGPHLIEVEIPEVLRGWQKQVTPHVLRGLEHLPLRAARRIVRRLLDY